MASQGSPSPASGIRIRVGTQRRTTDGLVEKISFKEIVFQATMLFPKDTYLYGRIESTFFPPLDIKGRVLSVDQAPPERARFGENLHRLLVLVKGDEYFRFIETLGTKGERRKAPRLPARVTVQFLFDTNVPAAITTNICRNGISVFTRQRFEVGEILTMKLAVPRVLDEVVVVGKVVYVHVDGKAISSQPTATLERYGQPKQGEDLETEAFARSLEGAAKKAAPAQDGKEFELGVEFMRLLPDARQQYDAFIKRLEEKNIPFKILEED